MGPFRKRLSRLNRKDERNMWETSMDIGLSNILSLVLGETTSHKRKMYEMMYDSLRF